MNAVRASREAIVAALAPVVPCLTYVPEVVNPPLAVLVPGRPFMTTRDAGFCRLLARFEVFLLAPVGTNEGMTDDLDGLLMQAVAALWDVVDVTDPGAGLESAARRVTGYSWRYGPGVYDMTIRLGAV